MPSAVISGAASGIGRGLAEGFLDAGYRVTGIDIGDPSIAAEGYEHRMLDVRDDAAVSAFGRSLDRLDVLVNAAGIIRRDVEFEAAAFSEVIDINLTGTMRLCMACREALLVNGGSVINLASLWSFFGGPRVPAYTASKGGVAALTKSLAVAWASENIRVNALAPGWIATPLTDGIRQDADRNAAILGRVPMGRWGEPADVLGPALFLASDAARYVTGVVLPVDGGYTAM